MAQEIEAQGGGNAIVVSHGMTIGTFMWLIDNTQEKQRIENGSISVVTYKDGKFKIETVADLSYREKGREIIDANEK